MKTKIAVCDQWNAMTASDRIFVLNAINIVGRVAFQLSQSTYGDLDEDIQLRIKELSKCEL